MNTAKYAVGVDFGTSSVRAGVFRCENGVPVASAETSYISGQDGILVDEKNPLIARQAPADYCVSLVGAISGAIKAARTTTADFSANNIVGIGIGATASTPLPVDAALRPLSLDPNFAERLDANAWLWKDHSAYEEAEEITSLARQQGRPYLDNIGGSYSSEWFWAKVLACTRRAPDVFDAATSWIELSDFVPAWLSGVDNAYTVVRNIGAAGHKGLYSASWGGFPDDQFLGPLDKKLIGLRDSIRGNILTCNEQAGRLSTARAAELGVPPGIPIAAGGIDAHLGAVGANVGEGRLVKSLGTSACDIAVTADREALQTITGISGVVDGSVIPGMVGIEAGQAAVGDLFAWASKLGGDNSNQDRLTHEAASLAPGASGLIALDWNNGNRSVLNNPRLSGLIVGQSLSTTPAEIYRAMIEATGFGARMIVDHLRGSGTVIEEMVVCGGIAQRNALVLQTFSDILNLNLSVAGSTQTCALGAAMFGAVVGGVYDCVEDAQERMAPPSSGRITSNPQAVAVYRELWPLYRRLHDAFGRNCAEGLSEIMPTLANIRNAARSK